MSNIDKLHYECMKPFIDEYKNRLNIMNNEHYITETEYVNLGVTRLQNNFYEVYAKSLGKTKTELLKDFIDDLMDKNPDLVPVAIKQCEELYED